MPEIFDSLKAESCVSEGMEINFACNGRRERRREVAKRQRDCVHSVGVRYETAEIQSWTALNAMI